MKNPIACITGINGFVGPFLKDELEREGYMVVGIGKEKKETNNTYACVDVRQSDQVMSAFIQFQPTHVFHLAGISSPVYAEEHEALTYAINVDGTKNILDAACALRQQPRVLLVSSSHVYGSPTYLPLDENHPLLGKGVYAGSRIAQERVAKEYEGKTPLVVARSFNHTGPGQPDTLVIPKIIKHIVEIKMGLRDRLEIGNSDIERDITAVQDVARAYRLLLEQDHFGITVNVCRGECISLKKVIEYATLEATLDHVTIVQDSLLLRHNDPHRICGNSALLKRYIDWEPRISYNEMIKNIFHYWESTLGY